MYTHKEEEAIFVCGWLTTLAEGGGSEGGWRDTYHTHTQKGIKDYVCDAQVEGQSKGLCVCVCW